jgi:hypothetical protein
MQLSSFVGMHDQSARRAIDFRTAWEGRVAFLDRLPSGWVRQSQARRGQWKLMPMRKLPSGKCVKRNPPFLGSRR